MDQLQERYLETIAMVSSSSGVAKALLHRGVRPQRSEMLGWGYRGFNTFWGAKLGNVQEFMKVFFYDELGDNGYPNFHGYNLVVKQNGPESDLEFATRHGESFLVQGAFYVGPTEDQAPLAQRHPNALWFNYGGYPRGIESVFPIHKNPVGDGRWLRDYVVQPYEDEPGILLGRPYLRVPVLGIHVPVGYFILKRDREVTEKISRRKIRHHFHKWMKK